MLKKIFPLVFVLVATILTVAKTYLVWPLPTLLNSNARHDDYLFIKLANNLIRGKWLGEFDYITLVKGPMYSFFIALNSYTSFPLKVSEYLLYALACFIFYKSFKLISKTKILPEILLLLLILSPYVEIINNVTRESIYSSLTILIIAFFNLIYYARNRNLILLTFISIVAGFIVFVFWYTREEGIWILPYIIIVSSFINFKVFNQYKFSKNTLIRNLLCLLFIPSFLVFEKGFALKNKAVYGLEMTLDVKTKEQTNAFEALFRVKNYGKEIPYLQLNKATRAEIYKVSPSFKRVRTRLEEYAKKHTACKNYPQTCGDIPHGWFPWTFRLVANEARIYSKPTIVNKFYQKVADEINTACKDSLLSCYPPRNPNLAPFRTKKDTARFYKSFYKGISLLTKGVGGYKLFKYSRGKPEKLAFCAGIININSDQFFTNGFKPSQKKEKEVAFNINLLTKIYKFYNYYLTKLFFWGSLIGVLVALVLSIKNVKLSYLSISSVAIVSIILIRIVILSIIDATAFFGFQPRYIVCLFPLLMITFFYTVNDGYLYVSDGY